MKRMNSAELATMGGKHRQDKMIALLRLPQYSPGEKALYLVKRILLKQHGVLWYSEPVFEFFAMESVSSMVKVWLLYRF